MENSKQIIIKHVSGPTSSNKTGLIIDATVGRYLNNRSSLYVGPSKQTCNEVVKRYNTTYPGIPIEIYHSDIERSDSSGSIKIDVQRALTDISKGKARIVVICHATFINLDPTLDAKDWHVFIDETLDVFHPTELNLQDSNHLITDHLLIEDRESAYSRISSGNATALRAIAENRNKDAFRKIVREIADRTLNPHYDCYTEKNSYNKLIRKSGKEQKLYHISVLNPRVVLAFGGVTIFSARFEESLHYHLWKREGVEWQEDNELTSKLSFTKHVGYEKTKIYWGFERNFSKTTRDKHPEIYDNFIDRGLELVDGSDFIRLENNDIKDSSRLSKCINGKTIPGRSHGSNEFRHIDHAFIATATNYSPTAAKFLRDECGFDYKKQSISFAAHNIYQAVSRSSMRDGDLNRERIWIVASKYHAEWLSQIFEGSTCISLTLDQPSVGDRGRPGIYNSNKERKNQSQEIRRNKAQQQKEFIHQIGVDVLENVVLFHKSNEAINSLLHIDNFGINYRSSWFSYKKSKKAKVILMNEHSYINWSKKESNKEYTYKHDVPLVSPAFYNPLWIGKKGGRGIKNVVFASGFMLDFDSTDLKPRELADILHELQLLTYSTHSNSPNDLRYRGYIPSTRPMLIPEYMTIMDAIIQKIEDAGYQGKDKLPAKPHGSESASESERVTMPLTTNAPIKRHGIDMSKRGPYSLFHLPCRSPSGHSFCNDHSGPGRGPLDVNLWLSNLPPIERPEPKRAPSNYSYADQAHTLTDHQRAGVEQAMGEWLMIGTQAGEGNDGMWNLYESLRDLHLPTDLIEEQLRFAANTSNTPNDRHEQVDDLMEKLRSFRACIGFNSDMKVEREAV